MRESMEYVNDIVVRKLTKVDYIKRPGMNCKFTVLNVRKLNLCLHVGANVYCYSIIYEQWQILCTTTQLTFHKKIKAAIN